jgi:hypothetical protein
MPGPLRAQCYCFSSWTLTEYKSTICCLSIHVYSILLQISTPRCVAHVSEAFLFFLTIESNAFPTICKHCISPSLPPPSLLLLLSQIDRHLLFLKLSKFSELLKIIYLQFKHGSLLYFLQVSAQIAHI